MRCAVYRYRDAQGSLLYIGASSWPVERISQHFWCRLDMRQVVNVEITWFDTREEARVYEVAAIKAENPLWNIASRVPHDPTR